MGKRNTCVDVMKALLIISMVIGHSTSPWTTYIYLFHMPAFIVLSGYTYRGDKYTACKYVWKKFLTVLLPAFMINSLYIIFYCFMQFAGVYGIISDSAAVKFQERISGLLLYWATPDFGGATWFLVVLFETDCIIKITECLLAKLKKSNLFIITTIAIGCMGYFMIQYMQCQLPYYMDLALMACLYYGLGILLQRKNLLENIDRKVMVPFCLVTMIFFGSFYFYGKLPMNWPTRDFSNLFIQLLSCLTAIYVVWIAAGILDGSVINFIFQWIGKHTYCILVTHFFVFRFLFLIGVRIGKVPQTQLRQLVPDPGIASNGGWIVISLATVFICCMISKFMEKNRWTNYLFNARFPYKNKIGNIFMKGRENNVEI